jgi:deazaflavin-dependent oxidoreductase (nitroreductase family)
MSDTPSMAQFEQDDMPDSPMEWVAEHIRAYIETDGREGHLYQGWTTLLLTTRGRKSGKPRRTALIYAQDGDRYVLVGSNGGSPRHPAWYLNVVEHPEVAVQVGADKFIARARTATSEEKPALWEQAASAFPLYNTYQAKTDREIPVVIIERVS